jgi:hypothetical protein
MPKAHVIPASHVLALSLLTLGASTLHGVRSSSVATPTMMMLRPFVLIGGAQAAAIVKARERADRTCAADRGRGRDASDCTDS